MHNLCWQFARPKLQSTKVGEDNIYYSGKSLYCKLQMLFYTCGSLSRTSRQWQRIRPTTQMCHLPLSALPAFGACSPLNSGATISPIVYFATSESYAASSSPLCDTTKAMTTLDIKSKGLPQSPFLLIANHNAIVNHHSSLESEST